MKAQSWHRRHAIQMVAQLPEGTEDALMVLRLSEQLVTASPPRRRGGEEGGSRDRVDRRQRLRLIRSKKSNAAGLEMQRPGGGLFFQPWALKSPVVMF